MKRFSYILSIGLVALLVFGLVHVNQAMAAKYNWKFALEEIEGSVQYTWATEFKKRLEEQSNGEININIYPYGSLGSSEDISEQTVNGILEFAFSSPGHFATTIPEVGLFSLHYIWSDNSEVNKYVLENSDAIYGDISKLYSKKNVKLLSAFPEGWQIWTANKPLRKPADFKGLKFRVMGDPVLIADYKAYGANPVRLAYSEIYSALQLNMIDAEVQPYFAIQEMKFYEQQDYLIDAKQLPFITTVIVNQNFFKSLPEKYQKMIVDTARGMTDYIFDASNKLNQKRLKMMLKAKPDLKVIKLTDEERDAFRQKAKTVWAKYMNDSGDSGKAILEKLLQEIKDAEAKFAE